MKLCSCNFFDDGDSAKKILLNPLKSFLGFREKKSLMHLKDFYIHFLMSNVKLEKSPHKLLSAFSLNGFVVLGNGGRLDANSFIPS